MKRITAIAIVAVAILGSSYVGAASNCVELGREKADYVGKDLRAQYQHVVIKSCEVGRLASRSGLTYEEIYKMLDKPEIDPEYREIVLTGFGFGSEK